MYSLHTIVAHCLRGRLNYLVYGRGVGLNPSRVTASPQWGLPPDQLIKQIKDGILAAKEAIEHFTETLPRIQKVKQERANEEKANCITLLEQHTSKMCSAPKRGAHFRKKHEKRWPESEKCTRKTLDGEFDAYMCGLGGAKK